MFSIQNLICLVGLMIYQNNIIYLKKRYNRSQLNENFHYNIVVRQQMKQRLIKYQDQLKSLKKYMSINLNPLKTETFFSNFEEFCVKFHKIISSFLNTLTHIIPDSFYQEFDSITIMLENSLRSHKRQVFREMFFQNQADLQFQAIKSYEIDQIQQFINCQKKYKINQENKQEELEYFLEKRQLKQKWIKDILDQSQKIKTNQRIKNKMILQKLQRISIGTGDTPVFIYYENSQTQTQTQPTPQIIPQSSDLNYMSTFSKLDSSPQLYKRISILNSSGKIKFNIDSIKEPSSIKFPDYDSKSSLNSIESYRKLPNKRSSIQGKKLLQSYNIDAKRENFKMKTVIEDYIDEETNSKNNIEENSDLKVNIRQQALTRQQQLQPLKKLLKQPPSFKQVKRSLKTSENILSIKISQRRILKKDQRNSMGTLIENVNIFPIQKSPSKTNENSSLAHSFVKNKLQTNIRKSMREN